MISRTCSIILGGGRGTRLYPLVKYRSKPAVPLGGKYRMIDIPISNCINSGFRQIFVMTQFQSASLNNHITRAYNFDAFSRGFVQVLAAEQSDVNMDWFQGTADAVRKHLSRFNKDAFGHILILSGDQVYRMDYRVLVENMINNNADVVVGTVPVTKTDAGSFGIMRVNNKGQIASFVEKPQEADVLEKYKLNTEQKRLLNVRNPRKNYLASMGIYLFRKEILIALLEDQIKIDFGRDIIPAAIKNYNVYSHAFDGYWEDVGTITAYFEANIALGSKHPPFDFYDERAPIYTRARFLSGSKIEDAQIFGSVIADGCQIAKSTIVNSVIGVRSIIRNNTNLERVVMMGADFYEADDDVRRDATKDVPSIGIGENCVLKNVIIDKNVCIGDNVTITNQKQVKNMETTLYSIRDGIVIIPKNTAIKNGTVI